MVPTGHVKEYHQISGSALNLSFLFPTTRQRRMLHRGVTGGLDQMGWIDLYRKKYFQLFTFIFTSSGRSSLRTGPAANHFYSFHSAQCHQSHSKVAHLTCSTSVVEKSTQLFLHVHTTSGYGHLGTPVAIKHLLCTRAKHCKYIYQLTPIPKHLQRNLKSLEANTISFSMSVLASSRGEHLYGHKIFSSDKYTRKKEQIQIFCPAK